jgi:hypothetical protein
MTMGHSFTLHEFAGKADGIIDRRSAVRAGIPDLVIDHELDVGRLQPVHPGVYRAAAVPLTLERRLRAALLAAGQGSVLSHRSAAARHGLLGGSHSRIVEVLVPHHVRPRLADVVVHRTRSMPTDHVVDVRGLATTSVDRTLADLGAVVGHSTVERTVEQAVIDRQTSIERLYRFVDSHGRQGRSGIGALRAALDAWVMGEAPPDSVLEVMLGRVVERASLPAPVFQLEVVDGGGHVVARVDAAWPGARLVVEVDGLHAHASAAALQSDLRRQNRLIGLGWTVLRFTWRDVVRSPHLVAVQIRAFLAPVAA